MADRKSLSALLGNNEFEKLSKQINEFKDAREEYDKQRKDINDSR